MIASDTVVTADSQDLEIILGCSIGILFGLAIIITITVIAGILIKGRFKGNYYSSCIFNNCSIIHVHFSFNLCVL
jgi:hypothetical protein